MPDPFESFKSFSQRGVDVDPLPASEVRRRGDRLRRRNHLVAAAGALAAVVVIATPLALVAADRNDASPPPSSQTGGATPSVGDSPSPSVSEEPTGTAWVTSIPDDFPLAAGLPAADSAEYAFEAPSEDNQSVFAAGTLSACGASAKAGDFTDRLTTRVSGPEDYRDRELLLYADDAAAAVVTDGIGELYQGCPEESDGGPGTVTTTVVDLSLGEQGLSVRRAFSGVGTVVVHVMRVGNAVLVDHASDEGTDVGAKAAETRAALAGVVDAMGQFSDADPALGEVDLITVDQVPARERLTAWQQAELADAPTLACQPERLSALGADALVAREFRARIAGSPAGTPPSSAVNTAVLQFTDEAAASTAYDTVAGWIEDCSAPESGLEPYRYDELVQPPIEGGRGEWRHRSFPAPDVCEECDAARFHRMGVAQIGDRLALVELAEVGGPLEPEFLTQTMTELFEEVVAAARP